MSEIFRAIGLMSGTSLDGMDAAMIRTDGQGLVEAEGEISVSYDLAFRARLKAVLLAEERTEEIDALERELTDRHADLVLQLLEKTGRDRSEVDLIGFHGQTINHRPDLGWSWQLGLGDRLAAATGIDCVYDLRGADVAAGGQGAPMAPVYHRALAGALKEAVIVLNMGGVSNITYLANGADPIAFDTGPANALLDDWMVRHAGKPYDEGGAVSASGTVDETALSRLMDNAYFDAPYPKSLDREAFDPSVVDGLSVENGAATLAAFTVESVAKGVELLPGKAQRILVTGGGRRNPTLMLGLVNRLGLPVEPVETVGWNGDMLEAQAFAYMAVRSRLGLPISFPTTTGAPQPLTGGRYASSLESR